MSTLDSRQLLAFATLARCGSFTQTARELHLTQSAISHAIKALEQDIGVALFDRVGKKVFLTQAGERLRPVAERILRDMEEARSELQEVGAWGKGRLRLGATTTACQHLVPTVLREFRESFPECAIHIQVGDGPQLTNWLLNNEVDLALMPKPEREEMIETRPLFNDELKAMVPPWHPWAVAGRVCGAGWAAETAIVFKQGTYTHARIEDFFQAEECQPAAWLELSAVEAMKELAKVGIGAALLAPWVARQELAEQSLVAVAPGRTYLRRTWCVGFLRGRTPSLSEETFAGLCEAVAQSVIACGRA